MLYGPSIFLAKLTLMLLYLRIFEPKPMAKYLIYAGILVIGLFYAATTIAYGAYCVPRSGESYGSPSVAARCNPPSLTIDLTQGVFGFISDLYLFILPMPFIWGLQVPLRRKLGIAAVFATGVMYVWLEATPHCILERRADLRRAIIASALGVYFRTVASHSADTTWTEPPAIALASVEYFTPPHHLLILR